MAESEPPAEPLRESLPVIPFNNADEIYDLVRTGHAVLIHEHSDTRDPFKVEVFAQSFKHLRPNTRKQIQIPEDDRDARLKVTAVFRVPASRGEGYVNRLRSGYRTDIANDHSLSGLVRTSFMDNGLNNLRIGLVDEPDISITTFSHNTVTPPWQFVAVNERHSAGRYASKAPKYDEETIGPLLSKYMGLIWIVSKALGDDRVPVIDNVEPFGQDTNPLSRRRTRAKPRVIGGPPSSQTRRINEKIRSLTQAYRFNIDQPLLTLSEIQGLDPETVDEIKLRVDLATEPAGARRWGATALGGIFIHGESGQGKTSLARAITAPADLQWHIRAADIIDEANGNRTSDHIRQLGTNIGLATKDGYSLGVILDEIQPVIEKMSAGVVREEVRDFIKRTVLNPTVLLVATMTKRPGASAAAPELLRSAALNGHGFFDLSIEMTSPTETIGVSELKKFYSKTVMDLMKDELVDGKPVFEVPTPEGMASLVEGLVDEGSTVSEIEYAILVCRANKFRQQRELNGQFPGSITIQDIADAITKSKYTEVQSTKDSGNVHHLR